MSFTSTNSSGSTTHTVTINDPTATPSPFWAQMMASSLQNTKCTICGTVNTNGDRECQKCRSTPKKMCYRQHIGIGCQCTSCKRFENPLSSRSKCIVCDIKH